MAFAPNETADRVEKAVLIALSRTHSGLVDWRLDVRYGHAEPAPRLAQASTRMESVRRWRDQPDVWVAKNVLH